MKHTNLVASILLGLSITTPVLADPSPNLDVRNNTPDWTIDITYSVPHDGNKYHLVVTPNRASGVPPFGHEHNVKILDFKFIKNDTVLPVPPDSSCSHVVDNNFHKFVTVNVNKGSGDKVPFIVSCTAE